MTKRKVWVCGVWALAAIQEHSGVPHNVVALLLIAGLLTVGLMTPSINGDKS